jgi:hypothetical protein
MNIKKIIKEEIDNFDWVNTETPLSWLIDNFGDLTPVVKGSRMYYVNKNDEPFFYYNQGEENGSCYISYDKIWYFLESHFGINDTEVEEVITTWLEEVYGITGLTPTYHLHVKQSLLDEEYGITGRTPVFRN